MCDACHDFATYGAAEDAARQSADRLRALAHPADEVATLIADLERIIERIDRLQSFVPDPE